MTQRNKLIRLKREARSSASFRGHKLSRFQTSNHGQTAHAHCVWCQRSVFVDTNPAPNGIDIHGEAVALNCKEVQP